MINLIRTGGQGPELKEIWDSMEDELIEIFDTAVRNEKEWAKYLFSEGSMLGLNFEILCQYLEYIANVRYSAIGFDLPFPERRTNPLPWMDDWISSDAVQSAPQEVEIGDTYTTADLDVSDIGELGDFKL